VKILSALTVALLVAGAASAEVLPGEKAPDFTLTDTDGAQHSLQQYLDAGKVVVLEWFNPDCPFIKKHHVTNKTMDRTLADFAERGVVWLAVNSGAEGKQGAGLERNRKAREDYAMTMPILLDPDGAVGKRWGAKTTPHMFVIAADGTVVYAGAIDEDRSADTLGKTNYVAAALAAVCAGEPVGTPQTRAYGCSVKYQD